jgi:hypothetical protein
MLNKKHLIFFLSLISISLLFGCSKNRPPLEDQLVQLYKGDKEIISAIEFAYGLEEELWRQQDKIHTREDVFKIFRQGFSEELANEITNYLWMLESADTGESFGMLRAGDPILILPDSIEVKSKSSNTAIALLKYEENTEGPLTWEAYSANLTLKNESGTWKIYRIESEK